MTHTPTVHIVMVNCNGKAVTLACLETLVKVKYPAWKVTLIDNGSTDGSVQAIRATYPDVDILTMEANLGWARAANVGIRHVLEQGAELVLLLNNDTLLDPNFLDALVAVTVDKPDVGFVAPKIYYADEPTRLWSAGAAVSMWLGMTWHIGIRERDHGQYDTPREIPLATGCCILVRRELIEHVGLLDESYYMYTEDADWIMRARRAGYKVFYEPRAKIWHRLSVDTGGHLSFRKNKYKFLGIYRFFSRYASWYHWLVFPWMTLLANGFVAVRYLLGRIVRAIDNRLFGIGATIHDT